MDYYYGTHLISESYNHLELAWSAFRSLSELKALLRTQPCDIIHAHTRGGLVLAMLVAALLRRPILFTSHARGRRVGLYRAAARLQHLYMSLVAHEMARHFGLQESPQKIQVISEACADELFARPLPSAGYLQTGQGQLRLVGIGNLVRWKNWDLTLRAIALLDRADRARIQFALWGPTPDDDDSRRFEGELRALVRSNGLQDQVRLEGPSGDIPGVFAQSDCVVHPTTGEPCSLALIESLALGIPAIVSASGGSAEIVAHGRTGLHFEPDSATSLAACLRQVLRREVAFSPPAEIRNSVRHRSATQVAKAYEQVYQIMLAHGVCA